MGCGRSECVAQPPPAVSLRGLGRSEERRVVAEAVPAETTTMDFTFAKHGKVFEELVKRLFVAESRLENSDLSGFQPVSAELRGDLGVDGFLPDGTVFQFYYASPGASTPMRARERRKITATCNKVAQRRGDVESTVGRPLKRLVFVLARDPDVDLIPFCSETVAKLLPRTRGEIWGEARLSNLVVIHRTAVADLLPRDMRRALPKLQLALNVTKGSGDQPGVTAARRVTDPDPNLYGAFLQREDPRFERVANPGSQAVLIFHPHYQRWATYWYGLFLYHVNMIGCPRVRFQLSNLGDAYAYGIIVELWIPRELDLILAEDLPSPPARVPHPSKAEQTVSVATMIRRSNEGEDDEDSWQSTRWSYPRPDPPQYVRRTHTLEGVELSQDGTRLTWQMSRLHPQATPLCLECAVKPPYPDQGQHLYRIAYTIQCEECPEPAKGEIALTVEPLGDVEAMEIAWQTMNAADNDQPA